jgi:predicted DNA-binding transcriptional regulator AlpA
MVKNLRCMVRLAAAVSVSSLQDETAMTPSQPICPRRLQPLKVACARIGISARTYYRKPDLLPLPIKLGNKLMFAEHEIDALIDRLLAARDRTAA